MISDFDVTKVPQNVEVYGFHQLDPSETTSTIVLENKSTMESKTNTLKADAWLVDLTIDPSLPPERMIRHYLSFKVYCS